MAGRQHRIFSYVERGFYSKQVERLAGLFPGSNLLFLRNEDLRDRHVETLDRVCEFLGVDRFANYPEQADIIPLERVNVPPPGQPDLRYLQELFRSDVERTQALTGLDLSAW